MTLRPSVLLVAPTIELAATLSGWLTDAGFDPTVVASFLAAKPHLERGPSLLISEVRLGTYNGLHLALRAQAHDIPAIVLGEPDPVLERDARQLGAVYLRHDLDRWHFLSTIESLGCAARTVGAHEARSRRQCPTNLSFISWSECNLLPLKGARTPRAAKRRLLPS